jgi:hypothetical protein
MMLQLQRPTLSNLASSTSGEASEHELVSVREQRQGGEKEMGLEVVSRVGLAGPRQAAVDVIARVGAEVEKRLLEGEGEY